jgi:hypothetical protein
VSGVGGTAKVAAALAAPERRDPRLVKELLVPLRFLFHRMSIVFIGLTAVGAFALGLPYLLLGIVFWWQPLSANAAGPDVGGGTLRYALLGWRPRDVLPRRTLAITIHTVAVVAAAAVLCAALGWIEEPVVGPGGRWIYPPVFVYAVSLGFLWAVAGDRYSLRYPDFIEMHTLFPERKKSAGADAVVLLLAMWIAVTVTAGLVVGTLFLALSFLSLAAGTHLGLALLGAATTNLILYAAHLRGFRGEWR